MANNPLVLKFGTDFGDAQKSLGALASNVATNMASISSAAKVAGRAMEVAMSESVQKALAEARKTGDWGKVGLEASKAFREGIGAGAASAASGVAQLARETGALGAAVKYGPEALKLGFIAFHPVLGVGLQLLGSYKYILGGVAAGAITLAQAVKLAHDSFVEISAVVQKSDAIGVTATLFQVWTQQAEKTKLSVEQMEQALEHAAGAVRPTFDDRGNQQVSDWMKQSDHLQNGMGLSTQSYQQFKDAGDDMDKLVQAAASLVVDMQRAATATGDMRLNAAAVQTSIGLFGEKGRQIAEALKSGALSIEDVRAKAQELGTVFGDKIENETRKINEGLAEASRHLAREMRPESETLATIWNTSRAYWGILVDKMAQGAHWLNQMVGTSAAVALNTQNIQIGNAVGIRGRAPVGDNGVDFSGAPLPPRRPALATFGGRGISEPRGRGAGGTESLDEVERLIQSLDKQNAALKGEADAIGKSNQEKERSIDLSKAEEAAKERGAALTDAERQKVVALADAHAQLRQKIDDSIKADQNRQQTQSYFGDTAANAVDALIVKHEKLKNVLQDVVKQLESAALKSLLTGSGPLAGLFGTQGSNGNQGGIFGALFGLVGGHADGGVAGFGTPTLAPVAAFRGGRHFANGGGIPSILHAGEIVLNAAQQKNVADNMRGGNPNVVVHNHAAGVSVEPYVTQGQMQLHVYGQLNAFAQQLPQALDAANKRS